jgi:hypothetical protein
MDLVSPHPFWLLKNGLLQEYPALRKDIRCDVVVLGAGISGALIAQQLVRARWAQAVHRAGGTALLLPRESRILLHSHHHLAKQSGLPSKSPMPLLKITLLAIRSLHSDNGSRFPHFVTFRRTTA